MLFLEYLRWWYGPGWRDGAGLWRSRLARVYFGFSVPILLPTMLAPWKRIITYPARGLGNQLRAAVDNIVSRAVGLAMRLGALLAAVLIMAVIGIVGGLLLLAWPLVPLLGPALVVVGLHEPI